MTLYELIMSAKDGFTRSDWAELGRRAIQDEETVKKMVMEGYSAIVDED